MRNTSGKERDSESGLDYFSARYYGSSMGRFTSPDPLPWIHWQHGNEDDQKRFEAFIANPQDLNMYAYVLNNPLNKTDPTGMNACGTNNDSGCKVTVTLQDRTKDANGHYNDQFAGQKGDASYNATATVSVNGKVVGTFIASTVPSGPGLATLQNGTYNGTLGFHDGHAAIRINGGGPVPVVGGRDAATGKPYAEGILVHIAGLPTAEHPLGGTGMTHSGKAISEGCQLICSTQYHNFEQVTGMRPSDGS
ncbi:MAG TPA: RHS repeat-associated core domain-containing protein, partial [Edaphobacter sp.]|nr:RHS repeat-associated core domain-containing protein [Edaphobacter sp.]